jgi:hypothetical protein
MTRDELVKALTDATSLVMSAGNGEISLEDFLEAYGSFYYAYALDGHEAYPEERLLNELQWAIEFHRKVQEEVLNRVYLRVDLDRASLNRIGRIDLEQAGPRLSALCKEQDAEGILRKLSECPLCKPHSQSAEQVAEIVLAALAAYEAAPNSPKPTFGSSWSESRVRESMTALRASLVTPYVQRFRLKDTAAEMRQSPPEIEGYWVVARSQQFLVFYDLETQEYGLAMRGRDGTLPQTIGVRGDLVGVFGAM